MQSRQMSNGEEEAEDNEGQKEMKEEEEEVEEEKQNGEEEKDEENVLTDVKNAKRQTWRYRMSPEDLRTCFKVIKLLGFLNFFPFDFNSETGKFIAKNYCHYELGRAGKVGCRRGRPWNFIAHCMWHILIFSRLILLLVMIVLYMVSTRRGSSKVKDDLAHCCLLLIAFVCASIMCCEYLQVTLLQPINHVTILNGLLSYLQGQGSGRTQGQVGIRLRFWEHSLHELCIIYAPYFCFPLLLINPLLMLIDPRNPMLLTSLVTSSTAATPVLVESTIPPIWSEQLQNWSLFILLATLDFLFFVFIIGWIVHGGFCLTFFQIRVKEETRRASKGMVESGVSKFTPDDNDNKEAVGRLKLIKLLMVMFNQNLSLVVWCWKLVCLTGSILGGFAAIKMTRQGNVPYAVIYGGICAEGMLWCIIMYDKSHEIPRMTNQLKQDLVHATTHTGNKEPLPMTQQVMIEQRKRMKRVSRELRAVQRLGLQCGTFNLVERQSTLIFVGFTLHQIVSLLLAFK